MTNSCTPFPIFDSFKRIQTYDPNQYPQCKQQLASILIDKSHQDQHLWCLQYLQFIARNKACGTYDRFRNECERFLLWLWLKNSELLISNINKLDILRYIDFIHQPDPDWVGTHGNVRRFILINSQQHSNPKWRPFIIKSSNKTRQYHVEQSSLTASFTALSTMFSFWVDMQYIGKNPVKAAKKDCRHLHKNKQVALIHRLNELQWQAVLDSAEELADEHPKFERNLFLVACLKTLYLRISELSNRPQFNPVMSHFWQADGYWWLKVFGKGNKIRDVSVPNDFLAYLQRYRQSRGLPIQPMIKESTPIISNIAGNKGLTARQLRRLVQTVFDHAHQSLIKQNLSQEASELQIATTHWLRHTGASMDIENQRDLKYLSEDLGHASVATTDKIYVQTDIRNRAESGKYRKV